MTSNKIHVGDLIKAAREAAGMKQGDLAERCGWPRSQGRVSHYETGRSPITVEDLIKICEVLGIETAAVFAGYDHQCFVIPKAKAVKEAERLADELLRLRPDKRKMVFQLIKSLR